MRIALSLIGVAVVITAIGCQQETDNKASSKPDTEPSTAAKTEPADPPENTAADAVAAADAPTGTEQTESEDHDHSGPGMMGRGPRGMGHGKGRGQGGMGRGPGGMSGMRGDMNTLHTMFASRDKIKRTIKKLPDGAEATTESDDDEIASLIQEHVPAMEGRVLENKPLPPMTFHPIFVELIKHSEDYTLTYEETEKGMKVTYNAKDPFVVMLVQEHAKLVSRFIKNGMEEIHKPYTLPALEQKGGKESVSPPTKVNKSQTAPQSKND